MSKSEKTAYRPDSVSPPGQTLQDTLDMLGISPFDFAERIGCPLQTINEIIRGITEITPDIARELEQFLRVPAWFWLKRESQYRNFRRS